MASLNQDQLKVLEQTRQRLVQLTQSLGSLVNSINQSDPLPAWSSLQSQASIISTNLVTISQLLNEHHDLLSSMVAYPTPDFPGRTESAMLNQLMRTKLEPRVEDWVAYGRTVGNEATQHQQQQPGQSGGVDASGGPERERGMIQLTGAELDELWHWAPVEANTEARRRNWGGDYTLEEKQMGFKNVVTGLKRRLNENVLAGEEDEEEEEEEEEEEGDEMEIVGVHKRPGSESIEFDISPESAHVPSKPLSHALPLEDVFRYMMTGAPPQPR